MSKEAMKLALEALEWINRVNAMEYEYQQKARESLNAIYEALAEQPAQQEPVVWMYVNRSTHETIFQRHMRSFVDHGNWTETPLYSEPLANHELNCVCGAVWCGDEMVHLPHKSTPPQRKPLTREGIADIAMQSGAYDEQLLAFARAIEAAHGIMSVPDGKGDA